MAYTQEFTDRYDLMRERVRELEQKIHYSIERVCELSREITMDMVEKDHRAIQFSGFDANQCQRG